MNDTTLHLRVESSAYIILSIIDWFVEKLMTSLLSVCWIDGLLRMIVFIVIVFLPTIFIKCLLIFLCNELTLAILYHVVGTGDDANLHLLSTQMNTSRWCYCFLANHCHQVFVDFFYAMNSPLQFCTVWLVPVMMQTFICYQLKWTTVDDVEGDSFVGAAKPTW